MLKNNKKERTDDWLNNETMYIFKFLYFFPCIYWILSVLQIQNFQRTIKYGRIFYPIPYSCLLLIKTIQIDWSRVLVRLCSVELSSLGPLQFKYVWVFVFRVSVYYKWQQRWNIYNSFTKEKLMTVRCAKVCHIVYLWFDSKLSNAQRTTKDATNFADKTSQQSLYFRIHIINYRRGRPGMVSRAVPWCLAKYQKTAFVRFQQLWQYPPRCDIVKPQPKARITVVLDQKFVQLKNETFVYFFSIFLAPCMMKHRYNSAQYIQLTLWCTLFIVKRQKLIKQFPRSKEINLIIIVIYSDCILFFCFVCI